ncbi:PX domain-containing protein [Cladophialophora carrionii]|uniref:PX domain-containing protein n=1 Tax=Cladophialophora carrionii TaxID=86049 RepID=A0A1C1CYT8_9EURO|nr:PX domain-containing protein [Cladophialophora carrionii]
MEERPDSVEATEGDDDRSESSPVVPKHSAPPPTQPAQPLTTSAVVDATLKFLANASNETLGACAVGLCASTYLVLGRVGLVLIGAVGGVVLHATWESHYGGRSEEEKAELDRRRKELGVEVARRVLDWRERRAPGDDESDSNESKVLDYSDFEPETRASLTNFTDAVMRDYVRWWYSPLLPKDQSFPAAARNTFTSFVLSVSNHLSRKRAADPVLDFFANSTSIIIVFLNELSTAIKASAYQDAETAIKTYLQLQPESSLANVLSRDQQDRKFTLVADDILQNFLDPKAYNCPPVKAFLREVLAGLVLETTVDMCSKPEWINGWIVFLLEQGEPEIMNAIDAGVEDMSEAMSHAKENLDPGKSHNRRVSRAEEAMQEAMREAQRLNEMIAEDEARRKRGVPASEPEETSSVATNDVGLATPTSSDSDRNRQAESSLDTSLVFDNDGNAYSSTTSSPSKEQAPFTNFDQLTETAPNVVPPSPVSTAPAPVEVMMAVPLTLHNASITILDLGDLNEKSTFRQRPNNEYLLQIEPASQRYPGWMVSRRYPDFEPLHQTLTTIARISGVPEFGQKYPNLPSWRGQTGSTLTQSLEAYLKFIVRYEPLAETEAMKKFLDKETGLQKAPAQSKNVLVQGGAALENVGKNFINVLGQGGKNIAGGGKAVLGGVQGVFGAVATGVQGAPKRLISTRPSPSRTPSGQPSISASRFSQELPRQSSDSIESRLPPLPARPTVGTPNQEYAQSPISQHDSARQSEESISMPPLPSMIPDDYQPLSISKPATPPRPRQDTITPTTPAPSMKPEELVSALATDTPAKKAPSRKAKKDIPISEEETRILVELIFAILTELYSMGGAWSIRLSLLGAAKTFLLRPNNPQLESIRTLIQESVVDANFSDKGLATHINTLRYNTLPTAEEKATWPKELTSEEKEALRIKARRLLVERGMPQALTSVMGAAASGEALGKVFDCLQVESVARGLIFALMLQAIRATTQ